MMMLKIGIVLAIAWGYILSGVALLICLELAATWIKKWWKA